MEEIKDEIDLDDSPNKEENTNIYQDIAIDFQTP